MPTHRILLTLSKPNSHVNPKNLNFIFQQIYQNNLPPPIKQYFTNVYLFCFYNDHLDKSKLRPLGIPTTIWHLIASHVAHTFCKKNAHHMLPFNYAIGTPNGTNLIINTMQLQVEKYVSLPQSTGCIPTHAAIYFDLTNQFNGVSCEAIFNVIENHFRNAPTHHPILQKA
jgi:hypothetical protein